MPLVDVKGVGTVEFPDAMSEDEILAALQKKFPQQQPTEAAALPPTTAVPTSPAAVVTPPPPGPAAATKRPLGATRSWGPTPTTGPSLIDQIQPKTLGVAPLANVPMFGSWGSILASPLGQQIGLGLVEAPIQLGRAGAYVLSAGARAPTLTPFVDPFRRTLLQRTASSLERAGQKLGEYSQAIGDVGQAVPGPDIARELTGMAGSLVPSLAGGAVGSLLGMPFAGMIAGAATHQFGATYGDALEAYKAKGDPNAHANALVDALGSGAITAVTTAAFGRTGEQFLARVFAKEATKLGFLQFLVHAGLEATEEGIDQLFQSILAILRYRPELTWKQAFKEIFTAMGGGLFLSGAALTPKLVMDAAARVKAEKPPVLPAAAPPAPPVAEKGAAYAVQEQGPAEVPVRPPPEDREAVGGQVRGAEAAAGARPTEAAAVTPIVKPSAETLEADPQKLESAGLSKEDIYAKTGMWKSPGGFWIPDISVKAAVDDAFIQQHMADVLAKERKPTLGYKLPELLGEKNQIFERHPELRKITVYLDLQVHDPAGGFSPNRSFRMTRGPGAIRIEVPVTPFIDPVTKKTQWVNRWVKVDETKAVGEGKYTTVNDSPSMLLNRILTHEITHALQLELGLPEGGSPLDYFIESGAKVTEEELVGSARTYYKRLAGEAVARLSEERAKMSDAALKAEPPWVTLDKMLRKEGLLKEGETAENALILKFFGKPKPVQPPAAAEAKPAEPAKEVTPSEEEVQGQAEVTPEAGAAPTAPKPPPLIGLGAAAATEFVPPPGITSVKNAQTDAELKARGLPPLMAAHRQTDQAAWDEAMLAIDADAHIQETLIEEVVNTPRPLTKVENMLLLHRKVELLNASWRAGRDVIEARDDGRLDDLEAAQKRFDSLQDQIYKWAQAARLGGTELGRGLQARKAFAAQDFSLVAMETTIRAIRRGGKLTPEEHAQIEELSKKLQETQMAFDAYREQVEAERSSQVAGQEIDDVIRRVSKEKLSRKARKSREIRDPQGTRDTLLESLRKRAEEEPGEFPPNLSLFANKLAELYVRMGIREREALIDAVHADLQAIWPAITRRQSMDAISRYGQFKQLDPDEAKAVLRQRRGEMQQVAKLQDMAAGIAPKKTGTERPVPEDEWRRLTHEVNEAKKRGGYIVTDPAKQLRSLEQMIKTRLRHQIADLEFQIATGTRIVHTKPQALSNAEIERLKARRDELREQFDAVFGTRQMTDQQRSAAALRAVERAIADTEGRLSRGEYGPRPKKPGAPETPELAAARERLGALRDELAAWRELINPKKSPTEIALQIWKTRTAHIIADQRERMARGDLQPKARRELDLSVDPAAVQLLKEREQVREEWQRRILVERIKNMTRGDRIWFEVGEALNFSRNALSSYDISATGRQGLILGVGRPVDFVLKGMKDQLRALLKEGNAEAIDAAMRLNPIFNDFIQSDGYFAPLAASRLSSQEELTMSRWAHRFPGIRASNRAFITFLNWQRLTAFKSLVESQRLGGYEPSLEYKRAMAKFINIATGRGDVGRFGGAMELLAKFLWSPRLLVSRWQFLTGTAFRKAPWQAKKDIAKFYARVLLGTGVLVGLGLFAGAEIELDPRSADFGKLKFGNTRIDITGGLGGVVRFIARMTTGTRKTRTGEIVETPGYEEIGRYALTKAAPVPGTAVSLFTGKNIVGEEITPVSAAQGLFMPLSFHDTVDTMEELGVPFGTAVQLLETLGFGVQTYE